MKKRRQPEREYLDALQSVRDEIIWVAKQIEGVPRRQLAEWTGEVDGFALGTRTVTNFLDGTTRFPEARTLILMAHAVGADVRVVQRTIKVNRRRA